MGAPKLELAKQKKNDEFYTFYDDIYVELSQYPPEVFSGKVIYCNCDNYRCSQFVHYFKKNFSKLQLKKLIATCFDPDYSIFNDGGSNALYYEYDGVTEVHRHLEDNGSFDSLECLGIL